MAEKIPGAFRGNSWQGGIAEMITLFLVRTALGAKHARELATAENIFSRGECSCDCKEGDAILRGGFSYTTKEAV
jgi:hypothetical protein